MIEGDVTIIVQAATSFNVAEIIAARDAAVAAAAAAALSEASAGADATAASASATAAGASETAAAASAVSASDDADAAAVSAAAAAASAASIDPSVFVTRVNNLSDLASAATARTNLGVAIGTDVQAYDAELQSLADLTGLGLVARSAAGTISARSIVAGDGVAVTNGDGQFGNPSIALDAAQDQTAWNTGTDTTESTITPAKLAGVIATIPASTSTLELLSRTVISGTPANVDFVFDATNYDEIVFRLANIVPATDSADLWGRVSEDSGSSYNGGATAYAWFFEDTTMQTSPSPSTSGDASDNKLLIATSIGSAGGEDGVFGTVRLIAPSLAKRTHIFGDTCYEDGLGIGQAATARGTRIASVAVSGFRFLFSSGNFEDGGIISMYGVRNL